jgi:hypothetical protein
MKTPTPHKGEAIGVQTSPELCIIGQPRALPTVMTMHRIELQ